MLDPIVREDFPIHSVRVNNKPLIYFDNAATSQKPKVVIDKLVEFYTKTNANIHRGIHSLSEKATEEYERSKRVVSKFIGASGKEEIIYTRNTTESINLIAYSYVLNNLKKGDLIVSTEMEHHSNIVPWQLVSKKVGAKLAFIPIKDDYTLDMEEYKKLLKKRPKLVTFVHASNVLGIINPAKEMIEMAHRAGAVVLLDGAQSVPHLKVNVQELNCDFLVFSSHKMCGPTGIGVLYGKRKLLEKMTPFLYGGDMINKVTLRKSTWNKLPWKFEAGTPNIADAIAFAEAVNYLDNIGIQIINKHEKELVSYALKKLASLDDIKIFGLDDESKERGGMISFTIKGVHPHDIAQVLDDNGIAIRAGHHCAQPLHKRFNISASARISFYLYNTKEEIDRMSEALEKVYKLFK